MGSRCRLRACAWAPRASGSYMFEGRAAPYFLSPKGMVLIKRILTSLAPGSTESFNTYDESAMLMMAVAKATNHPDAQD